MKSKIHIIYIAIISILSFLLFQNFWGEYQAEKGMEILDELRIPKASNSTDEQLSDIFTASESELKTALALFEKTTNLCWIVKSDEDIKLSIFSNALIGKPAQINDDEK